MTLSSIFARKKLRNINYLELTPLAKHSYEIRSDGQLDVLVPRFKTELAKKFLMPRGKSPYIRANLDEFGSEVWLLLDGNKKVKQIAEALLAKFGERIEPVNQRLTMFLTQLYRNGFIIFLELEKGYKNG